MTIIKCINFECIILAPLTMLVKICHCMCHSQCFIFNLDLIFVIFVQFSSNFCLKLSNFLHLEIEQFNSHFY